MTSLQRAVGSPAPPRAPPIGFRRKIETAMELANEQLLWQVQLVDEASQSSLVRELNHIIIITITTINSKFLQTFSYECPTRVSQVSMKGGVDLACAPKSCRAA